MDAIEFVKKHGIAVAKDLAYRDKTSIGYLSVEHHNLNQDDLKQIVNAFELIDQCGGLSRAKSELKLLMDSLSMGLYHGIEGTCAEMKIPRLNKAINLVEQCKND